MIKKMKKFSCVIIVLCAVFKATASFGQFDETAWSDSNAKDKYFEYSDLTASAFNPDANNYNGDVNSVEYPATTPRARRHIIKKNQNLKVVDFFFNALTKLVNHNPVVPVVPPPPAKNESDKGLEVQLESATSQKFGTSQDFRLIYLGTKWCGNGDIAKNKRDIGYFYLTDSCCRAHDFCPQAIEEQQSKYGLKNTGKFTQSHCDCDMEFYRCLKSVNTLVSKQIGLIYFNVLGPQCFKEDYPMSCKRYIKGRCVDYTVDESKPKRNQWIDNKWF